MHSGNNCTKDKGKQSDKNNAVKFHRGFRWFFISNHQVFIVHLNLLLSLLRNEGQKSNNNFNKIKLKIYEMWEKYIYKSRISWDLLNLQINKTNYHISLFYDKISKMEIDEDLAMLIWFIFPRNLSLWRYKNMQEKYAMPTYD